LPVGVPFAAQWPVFVALVGAGLSEGGYLLQPWVHQSIGSTRAIPSRVISPTIADRKACIAGLPAPQRLAPSSRQMASRS